MQPSHRSHLVIVLGFAVALGACGDSGSRASQKPSGATAQVAETRPVREPSPALAKAIAWHGGMERLQSLKTCRLRANGRQMGRPYNVSVYFDRRGFWRNDFEIHDAVLSQAITPTQSWATFEGVPVPLEDRDREALIEGLRFVSLSLLSDLVTDARTTVTETPAKDGRATLEVRYSDAPKGPFSLVIETDGRLLSLSWNSPVFGYRGSQASRIEILGYGESRGIKLATESQLLVDGAVVQREFVSEIAVDDSFPASTFEVPANVAEPPIFDRMTAAGAFAWTSSDDLDDGAEERLAKWIERQAWRRAGPTIRTLPEAETRQSAVMIALDISDPETRPSTRPTTRPSEGPRVRDIAAERVLAMAGTLRSGAIEAAVERLTREATTRGLITNGPLRLVQWGVDRVQFQLPVRPKN